MFDYDGWLFRQAERHHGGPARHTLRCGTCRSDALDCACEEDTELEPVDDGDAHHDRMRDDALTG